MADLQLIWHVWSRASHTRDSGGWVAYFLTKPWCHCPFDIKRSPSKPTPVFAPRPSCPALKSSPSVHGGGRPLARIAPIATGSDGFGERIRPASDVGIITKNIQGTFCDHPLAPPVKFWRFYRHHADSKNRILELKNHLRLPGLSRNSFRSKTPFFVGLLTYITYEGIPACFATSPQGCAPVDHAVTPERAIAHLHKGKHLRTKKVQSEKSSSWTA